VAEGAATFCLVFFGTSAIIVNQMSQGVIGHVGISFVFGLVVLAMIYTFGSTSGAHMNPAVTIGFFAAGRISAKESAVYVAVQTVGALVASLTLRFLFPLSTTLGQTLPSGSAAQSFFIEFLFTAVLMMVIMGVAHDNRAEGLMAGVAIGATVTVEAFVGGPISGASMNPARSIGPALVSGQLSFLWIYLVATTAGSVIATKFFAFMHCSRSDDPHKVGCC
jgi:aquaporin Z